MWRFKKEMHFNFLKRCYDEGAVTCAVGFFGDKKVKIQ